MLSRSAQLSMLAALAVYTLVLLLMLRRKRLTLRYALLWIFSDVLMLLPQSFFDREDSCLNVTPRDPAEGAGYARAVHDYLVKNDYDRKTAQAIGRQFMKDAGLTKENAKELLTMPWEKIVERQKKIFAGLNLHTVGAVFDGENFEGRNALDIVLNKTGNNVPLMILTNYCSNGNS